MQLHEDLLYLARMIKREVLVYADVSRDNMIEIVLDSLISHVILAGQFSAQLDDKCRKAGLLKELRGYPFNKIFPHTSDILPVYHGRVETYNATTHHGQELGDIAKAILC